jgi:hypothetical protein
MKIDITIKDASTVEAVAIMQYLNAGAYAQPCAGFEAATADKIAAAISTAVRVDNPPTTDAMGQPIPQTLQPPAAPIIKAGDTGGDLDANGFPWNDKIHSGNQQKTAKGVWQKKRGVDDATHAAVEAEMRAAGFGRGSQPSAPVAPMASAGPALSTGGFVGGQPFTPPPNFPNVSGQPPAAPAPQAGFVAPQAQAGFPNVGQPQFSPPAAPAAPAQAAPRDFNALMGKISALFSAQQATPDYLTSICQRIGQAFSQSTGTLVTVNAITDISQNQAMVEYAFQLIAADGK